MPHPTHKDTEHHVLTVNLVLNLTDKWALFISDGSVVQFPKAGNPMPESGDKCRLYRKNDCTEGLFLKNKVDVYDILFGTMKPIVRPVGFIPCLSDERASFEKQTIRSEEQDRMLRL